MNRDRIIRAVVAALALGVGAPTAIYMAAQQEGVTLDVADNVVRGAIIDAVVTLRMMGRQPGDIAQIVAEQTGARVEDITPLLPLAIGRDGRDPRSIRSESLVLSVPVDQAQAAIAAGAEAFCEPLLLGGEPTSIHAECIASQSTGAGAPRCDAQGAVVGYVVRSPATPSQAERVRARLGSLEGEPPAEWVACPEVVE